MTMANPPILQYHGSGGSDKDRNPLYDYRIQRPNAASHKSEFPDEYLERVIMFAQSKKITKLWIDKECIYQRKEDAILYPNDKEHGVQIMDVVDGASTASVGLLTTPLVTKDEIDTLDSLIDRSLFLMADDTDNPRFASHKLDVRKVQMLILKVLSDERWSRGWIFQEDHLASSDMTLLIPCNESLDTHYDYDFGSLPGDLQINVKDFREAVTMFCLASSDDEKTWPNSEILSKAKQYNIWNKRAYTHPDKRRHKRSVYLWSDEGWKDDIGCTEMNHWKNHQDVNIYPTMTNSVLADICSRSVENEEDRIAILANALKFPKRLDTSQRSPIVQANQYSLSVAMLAQILINGEVLKNGELEFEFQPSLEILMQQTLQSYLVRCEYQFNAPNIKFEQSFIQRCRFRSPKITHRGIETKGFLFKLMPSEQDEQGIVPDPLHLSHGERARLRDISRNPRAMIIPRGQKLNLVGHEAIKILADKLDQIWPSCRLAGYLREHLQCDLDSLEDYPRSTSYVLDMMSAVCQALRDGRELRLARAASESDTTDPTAILISPPHHPRRESMYPEATVAEKYGSQAPFVFTSWDGPCSDYDRERIACLAVAIFDDTGARSLSTEYHDGYFIRSYGWVNGVFDFRGQKLERYHFPIPGITEVPDPSKLRRKRKRGMEDDNSNSNNNSNKNGDSDSRSQHA
jgi:hypothetical protein